MVISAQVLAASPAEASGSSAQDVAAQKTLRWHPVFVAFALDTLLMLPPGGKSSEPHPARTFLSGLLQVGWEVSDIARRICT